MTVKKIIIGTVYLGIIVWGFSGCSAEKETVIREDYATIVKTTEIETRDISFPIRSAGRVTMKKVLNLSFLSDGIVEKILVEEGETVKKGQILAQLNLLPINARVAQAQSNYEKSKRDSDRLQKLYNDNVASLEQLQDARTGLQVANSNLEIAEFNLKHSTITASSDGKILKRNVEANELVSAGNPIFIFAAADMNWVVRVAVTDRDIVQLRMGDSAIIIFDAYSGKSFEAKVSEVAEAPDQITGLYEIEISFPAPKEKLVSGMFASVDIFPTEKHRMFIIPIESLAEVNGNSGYVYTRDPNKTKAVRVPVEIAQIFKDQVAISSGLEEISEVITSGVSYLRNGSKISLGKETGDI